MKMKTNRVISLFVALIMALGMCNVIAFADGDDAAAIGDEKYETLEAAFEAAKDGDTITLLKDCAGNGIKVLQDKYAEGLTVDFAGHTYDVNGETVGSAGTETNGFQLQKGNTITLKNGTITSAVAKFLIQNYSNLTLDNMILDGSNLVDTVAYTLSTNNGSTTIKDTTIVAKEGGFAFDACSGWGGYKSNAVEVTGNSVISGDVEVSYYGQSGTDPATLTLTSGTMTGAIVKSAKGGDSCVVTKSEEFKIFAAATGNADFSFSISLENEISINFYAKNLKNPSGEEENDPGRFRVIYTYHGVEKQKTLTSATTNSFVVAKCAAKEISDKVNVKVLYDGIEIYNEDYSAEDYCENIRNESPENESPEKVKLVELSEALLSYGEYAKMRFDSDAPYYDNWEINNTIIPDEVGDKELEGNYYAVREVGASLSLESKIRLNIYFLKPFGSSFDDFYATVDDQPAQLIQMADGSIRVNIPEIAAEDLNKEYEIKIWSKNSYDPMIIRYSPLIYAKRMQGNESEGNICKALYLYHKAAKEYSDALNANN